MNKGSIIPQANASTPIRLTTTNRKQVTIPTAFWLRVMSGIKDGNIRYKKLYWSAIGIWNTRPSQNKWLLVKLYGLHPWLSRALYENGVQIEVQYQ